MGHAALDNEAATFLYQVYQRADAFLFGRRTYEIFAGYGSSGRFEQQPHRSGVEHAAQVRGIDHAHRPAMGGHDRPLGRRRGRHRRAERQAGTRAASARQRQLNAPVDHPVRDGVTIVHAT
jgi:hypothetical protein